MQNSNTYDQGVARNNTGYEKIFDFPTHMMSAPPPPWMPHLHSYTLSEHQSSRVAGSRPRFGLNFDAAV